MDAITSAFLVWFLLPLPLFFLLLRARKRLKEANTQAALLERELNESGTSIAEVEKKFAPVVAVEDELRKLGSNEKKLSKKIDELRESYRGKRAVFDELAKQVAIYEETLAFAELGVYEPHFDFGDSEVYKSHIKEVRARQKEMVSAKRATICDTSWTVEGSRAKGQTMINRQSRLTMRAFNNECEAAIANARWNNAVAMEKRILNAAKQINSANSSMKLEISDEYVALRLEELHLTHEYREQLKIEKDERAELARQEREEKKLLAEAAAAEKEEQKYQALLDKARAEAGTDATKIEELERALAEAQDKSERAKAMAEMTRTGYVYVISNIGSFGDRVVKIGLTRRLDPYDRVKELGDASVPFSFDTHAMIYSEEAPALEAALHKEFEDKRVNASNRRKEFFKVSLDEVKSAVERMAPDSTFHTDREAQEWNETLSRRNEALLPLTEKVNLPTDI